MMEEHRALEHALAAVHMHSKHLDPQARYHAYEDSLHPPLDGIYNKLK